MSIFQYITADDGYLRKSVLAWFVVASSWPLHGATVHADDIGGVGASDVIVLGRVSNNPRKHYAALDALGRYLAEHSDEIERHETLLAKDNDEMIEFLRTGQVDLVSETVFSALLYEQTADAKILLRQWKGGRPSYKTFFFAHKDSDIQKVEDVAGHLVAFEDSGSTSGYFIPKATLTAHGLTLKFADQPRRVADVGYVFADSEVNIVAWVARRNVDVGVISDVHWEDESRAPLGLKKDLRIFYKTPEIVRSVMVAGPKLSDKRLEDIVDILLGMHATDAGRETLNAFYKTEQFDRLVGDAKSSLDHVRSLFDRLGDAAPSGS